MFCWPVHLKGLKKVYHAAVAVDHKVYSFGGFCLIPAVSDRRSYMCMYICYMDPIDVHVFNTVSLRWIKLPPAATVTASGRGELPLEVSYMRHSHTAVLIGGVVYLWGGSTYREHSNVLHAFDVGTHAWFRPRVSGSVPESRYHHSACVLGEVMYVFGGFNLLTRYTNDIHKLDTVTMAWTFVNTRDTQAPATTCHSSTIIGKSMFVFGGRGDQDKAQYNTVRVFDTETSRWLSTPSAQLLPEGRADHSAFAHNGELYIFGGDNFRLGESVSDLWKFNPETFSWAKVECKGKGPCSWMSKMCCCTVGDRVVLFGGHSRTPVPVHNRDLEDEDDSEVCDLYILDLTPSLKTLCKLVVIQHGLQQSELPHDIRWELAAMAADGNRKTNMSVLASSRPTKTKRQRTSSRQWDSRKGKARRSLLLKRFFVQMGKKAGHWNMSDSTGN